VPVRAVFLLKFPAFFNSLAVDGTLGCITPEIFFVIHLEHFGEFLVMSLQLLGFHLCIFSAAESTLLHGFTMGYMFSM